MIVLLRVALLIGMPIAFLMASRLFPSLLIERNVLILGSICPCAWVAMFAFLGRLNDLITVPGLVQSERDRLAAHVKRLRQRVWYIGGMLLVVWTALWLLGSISGTPHGTFLSLAIGFLVGVEFSYLILLPGWFEELHRFRDRLVVENEARAAREAIRKATASTPRATEGTTGTAR